MAIEFKTIFGAVQDTGLKILVTGYAGVGKTVLCTTTGEPTLIVSAEAGLLSIAHADLPNARIVEITTFEQIDELYNLLATRPDVPFKWICIDSLSEIAEVVLAHEKTLTKDPRQAYGALIDKMSDVVRKFRDLPRFNVVMTAKMDRVKDDATGITRYGPMVPGNRLSQQLPYWFDEVFAMRVIPDPENGEERRWLQTGTDVQYEAKDRSGRLEMFEEPNLAAIAAKIRCTQPIEQSIDQPTTETTEPQE